MVPLPAGSPRRLADITAHDGTFSPDGRQVLFANGASLFLAKSDGSEPRKLLTRRGFRFTPDFRRMAPGFDSPSSTCSRTPALSGRPRPTGPVFTRCFLAGPIRVRSLTDSGRPMALITSSPTPRAPLQISGHCLKGTASSIKFVDPGAAHHRPPRLRSRIAQSGRAQGLCHRPPGAR